MPPKSALPKPDWKEELAKFRGEEDNETVEVNPQTSERTFIVGLLMGVLVNYDGKNGIVLREVYRASLTRLTDR
ncbi:hypothetical protein SPFM10_00219 [Salmonella phage SPFM10]|nr:hypothetical protein SPFM6_00231 [Salmonella phage SPFM6]VFR12623.1 hypothetical protein SPFM10_00219 [Salmonella phage SPFM10]